MPNARLMVVEDERIVGLHLEFMLKSFGYDVVANVANGEQALQTIEETLPDLVLMDVGIEGEIDGIDTAARIPPSHNIAVVYLTSYSDEATLERARATKPYGYLLKPFSERELRATIEMVLDRPVSYLDSELDFSKAPPQFKGADGGGPLPSIKTQQGSRRF